MTCGWQKIAEALGRLIKRFRLDAAGNIAIIFAFASTALVIGVGSGLDLSRAYIARQKLSEAAALTCQFSTRPSVIDGGATSNYAGTVNTYAQNTLTSLNWPSASAPTDTQSGASTNYFTPTPPTGASTSQVTTGVTQMWYNVPTLFLKIINVSQITVHAVVSCQPPAPGTTAIPLMEGFETPCTNGAGYCFTLPNGNLGAPAGATSSFPTSPGYTGSGGAQWYIMGYCLENDAAGVINASDPEGTHSVELDCDNGSGSAGNSSISSKVNLNVGYYELRYNYRSRVDYPNYDPTYICATTAKDLAWANDSNDGSFNNVRTNQMNVYLDQNTNGSAPLHTTIDGTQQLAGSNLIDMCVYSIQWVERSVKIYISTAGSYWLSFAADGASDSYGGQLDNIRLCQNKCAGSPQDNFPTAWLAANNGNVNKVLFEDTFETSPAFGQDSPNHDIAKGHTLDASYGTSGSASGWPGQAQSGWATAPYDQITYGVIQGAAQGTQYITLDGWNSDGSALRNRLISRPFLLDPGYYQVSYNYLSMVNFNMPSLPSFCVAAPPSSVIYAAMTSQTGTIRYYSSYSANGDTNTQGVFLASGQLVSTPIIGAGLSNATSYNNPDGTVSTTPTVPPDNVNYQNYNANVVNPLIDMCGYADNWQWIPRSVSVKITKPGIYWLSFSANGGTADGNGAAIDDVKLTALGSPYMSNAPTSPLATIPVPAPAPDTDYSNSGAFTGFYIVADPFTPTAANQ